MPTFDAHALVIGVSAYQKISPLTHKPDAEDVAAALADPALCGYPKENVRLLLQGEATRGRILEELAALAKRTNEDSTVFFYFSGHGGRSEIDGVETCFLLPVDASAHNVDELCATAVSGRELSSALRAVPATKLTVVLDCCSAAGVAEPRDGAAAPPPGAGPETAALPSQLSSQAVALLSKGTGRAVLAASRVDGSAYAMPQARNGIFTGHLLAGLRGEAQGTGGVIRILDLYDYVQRNTREEYAAQRPVFKAELEENYPVALYQGGVAPQTKLAAAPDQAEYDAFVSYAEAEAEWVTQVMVPRLEALGLKLCLEERDFALGSVRIVEMGRAVATSRYTVGVLSPAYLDSAFPLFQADLAEFEAAEGRKASFLPVMRVRCQPPSTFRMRAMLDMSKEQLVEAALQRLAVELRKPPRQR